MTPEQLYPSPSTAGLPAGALAQAGTLAKEVPQTPPSPFNVPPEQKLQQLDKLVEQSERILFQAKTVFPFDFFPDELTIDEAKVSFTHRRYFWTGETSSIEYDAIFNARAAYSLFFASLEVADRYFQQEPITIFPLRKSDAALAKRLIQGIMLAKKNGIDLAGLDREMILERIEKMGKTK